MGTCRALRVLSEQVGRSCQWCEHQEGELGTVLQVFSLGDREGVLEEVGKDSLISHIAADKRQKFT